MCDRTLLCVTRHPHMCHDSFMCDWHTHMWHTHMWHYSIGTAEGLMMSIRHVPQSRMMWLIYVTRLCNVWQRLLCDTTIAESCHIYLWQDTRMCDTSLLAQHQVTQVSDGAAWKGDGEVAPSSVKNFNAKQVYVCAWERERGREKKRERVCVLYMRVNVYVHMIFYIFFCIHLSIYM